MNFRERKKNVSTLERLFIEDICNPKGNITYKKKLATYFLLFFSTLTKSQRPKIFLKENRHSSRRL